MPIYEYQCQACGVVHEALQKVSDPLIKMCPECGKLKLKKLVSAPSFRLSGTGWYETDFKSDKDNKRNLFSADSQKESSSKDSKSEKKGEDKKTASDKGSQKTTKKSKKQKTSD
ncbi:MAG: zinc ribbon domain-containing protein [Gammaproteobacteria bacterium]|nr:zinc ribbon domain-containing protein [Gammaproteobacteria bacterium]